MKHHHRTGPCPSADYALHIVGAESMTVIARHHIHHHNPVMARYSAGLRTPHGTVRRPEQVAVNVALRLTHILQITLRGAPQALQMVHCMVSHTMPPGEHFPVKAGIFAHIIAYHEERGLYAETVEQVEHIRSRLRYGAVIEGEVDRRMPRLSRIEPELSGSVKPAEYRRGRFYYSHIDGCLASNSSLIRLLRFMSTLRISGSAIMDSLDTPPATYCSIA